MVFDKASAPDLQQAQPTRKQAMCKHMVDGRGCKGGDASAVKNQILKFLGYTSHKNDFFKFGTLWNYMRENGILFPMNTPPIQTINSTTTPLTFPARVGSKLWENMTWAVTSRHSITFKIVDLVVLSGLLLLYCACRVYISMASREVNKPNPPTPSLVPLQPITEALPDGIKQEQVDEIIKIFISNYRNCSRPDATPTQPIIQLGDLEKCREGRTANNLKTEQRLLLLARYLKNQKIITSPGEEPFIELRSLHYQFTLHEEFIKKLNTDLH